MRRGFIAGAAAAVAGAGALAAYALVVRLWHLSWGATDEEVNKRLPGDELVPHPNVVATHAVTVEAPAAEVWPWLVQIGQDRGGFYSYTWLENLVGCRMKNAGRIMPEFQHLQAGDSVRLHPGVPPLPVLICEPPHTLVLGSNTESPGTWGFYLRAVDEDTTRLVMSRLRSAVSHEGEYVVPSGPSKVRTDENSHELRCGMCGEVYFVNSETLEGVNTAVRAGLDNPFRCVDCEEEYDELAYEG